MKKNNHSPQRFPKKNSLGKNGENHKLIKAGMVKRFESSPAGTLNSKEYPKGHEKELKKKTIKERIRAIQDKNIDRKYISNGDFRRLEIAIEKQLSDLKERLIEWGETRRKNNDIYRIGTCELNDDWIEEIEKAFSEVSK